MVNKKFPVPTITISYAHILEIEYKMPFLKKNLKPTTAPDSENLRALKEMETKIPDQMYFLFHLYVEGHFYYIFII